MRKKLLKTVLLLFCLFLSFSAAAQEFVIGDCTYSIISETDLTVGVKKFNNSSYAGAVDIPANVNYNSKDYTVTTIETKAFYNCTGLTSITIPNSVTTIGVNAFYNCSGLTSITIPNSVITIGSQAFAHCTGLTSITIPNSVTTIGEGAYYDCEGLTQFIVSKDNASYCDVDGVLFTKDKTELKAYPPQKDGPEYSIPYSVTTISAYAFYKCRGLTSITIPNSVTTIGNSAFADCIGFTSITIPNSVITIGYSAFVDCSGLTSITIGNSVTTIGSSAFDDCSGLTKFIVSKDNASYCDIDGVLFTKDKTELLVYPNSKGSEYSIPNSVTAIGDAAFFGCSSLTSITIPNSVTAIGDVAFSSCSSLTSITIPNSVTTIGYFAFCLCTGLTSITIGNSVTTIGNDAFADCSSLTSITIPNSVTMIGNSAFADCSGLTSITIGNSVTTIGNDAFNSCDALRTVISLNPTAPKGAKFTPDVYANATLKIINGSLTSYKGTDGWKEFVTIIEDPNVGVDEINSQMVKVIANAGSINVIGAKDNTPIEIYTLNGGLIYSGVNTTIETPTSGLYVARIAGKSYKVIVK